MIFSMTGYASATAELAIGALSLELRSVNHRYLDLQIRMPEELRALEPALREAISGGISRGKVECRINFQARTAANAERPLNLEMVKRLAAWESQVRALLPQASPLSVAEVLHWNGVADSSQTAPDGLATAIMELLPQTLQDFRAARQREGEKLAQFLLERVEGIERLRLAVAPHIPGAIANYEARMRTRLHEALAGSDEERIRQEITLYASKIDVDEELSRLQAHLSEVRHVLSKGGIVGKRLDFMMQELNREANTLGSKSVETEVSRCAMDIKVLIEQMREQIQNIE